MSALPQLKLEPDPQDAAHLRLVFEPEPATWSFDVSKGTREQLREQLTQQITLFMSTAQPDDRFDETAQQTLRTSIRHLLLQWIGFRGLRIPTSG
jgi:hypothetical protein